jgi:hypothetical protein
MKAPMLADGFPRRRLENNTYAIVEVEPDFGITVTGFGKATSRELTPRPSSKDLERRSSHLVNRAAR